MNENAPKAFMREPLRRPKPERTQPKRGMIGAFGRSDWKDESRMANRHPLGLDTAPDAPTDAFDFGADELRAASDLVDRHIANGKTMEHKVEAGLLGQLSRLYSDGVPQDLTELITNAARGYADVMSVWVDMAGGLKDLLKTGGGQTQPHAASAPNPPVVIQASRPVELRVEMFRPAAAVTAQPLQSENPAQSSRISGVTIDGGSLRIIVADDQPAGSYHGLLLDGSSSPVGAVTVKVTNMSGAGE